VNIKGMLFLVIATLAACAAYDLLIAKQSQAKEL
jgi:hypothetical protein